MKILNEDKISAIDNILAMYVAGEPFEDISDSVKTSVNNVKNIVYGLKSIGIIGNDESDTRIKKPVKYRKRHDRNFIPKIDFETLHKEYIEQKLKKSEIARRHNVRPNTVKRYLDYYKIVPNIDNPYPINLFLDIFDCEKIEDCLKTEDMNDVICGLQFVLNNMLNERERKAVNGKYERKMSLQAISEEFGITKERVRQIIAKALRKMRHPIRRRYIEYGYSGFIAYEKSLKEREAEKELEDKLHPQNISIDHAKRMNGFSYPMITFSFFKWIELPPNTELGADLLQTVSFSLISPASISPSFSRDSNSIS